ncbi:MAG: caspase domain-containing protein, partial [Methylocella sp.]
MVKMISPIAVWFLSVLILTFWVGTALADKRVALIVGNGQYARISPKLANPANDAHDLAEALVGMGFDVILRTDVGKGEFGQALVEFSRKARNADTALFYYAGHGLQHDGKNYFLPTDIEVQDEFDFNYRAISQDDILYAVGQAKNVKIVILDACRDNPLARQFIASRSWGGDTHGLARIDSAEETIIAYATAPGHVANDGEGRNSPFTAALIRRIKEPGLEITTMLRRVTNDVFDQTGGQQRPEITSSLRTDYVLNPTESDNDAWSRVRDSTNPADFKTFIQKFPVSPFAREAQFRIDLFDRIRRESEEAKKETERLALAAEKHRQEEAAKMEAERLAFEAEKKRQEEAARKEAERIAVEAERKRLEEAANKEAQRLAFEAEKKRQEVAAKKETERLALEAQN